MGCYRNHCIVVSAWSFSGPIHQRATQLFPPYMVTHMGNVNGPTTIIIGPDGIKDGHEGDDEMDRRRAEFVDFLRSLPTSVQVDWFEASYGEHANSGYRWTRIENSSSEEDEKEMGWK